MALDPSSGRRSVSPTSSGRASPVPRNWRSQVGGDDGSVKDKAFRRYASNVERSLTLFDTTLQEWPDYISFLGRLLKSLQSHPSNIPVVPSKALVAKRLAQCLNPSLPSGVHQKALEVYNYIFAMISKDDLARDLPLYLPGLSSTLSFASFSVQNPFLLLVERHIMNLDGQALRPALKALILALLPGLEEETTDEFERTLKLLDGFKKAVKPLNAKKEEIDNRGGDEFFWQCFFLASITSNSRRLGALAYLSRKLPKLGSIAPDSELNGSSKVKESKDWHRQAEIVTSPEPGLLLRCFAAGLADEQPLVQRGYLDLLVTHLPLNSTVLQKQVKAEDLDLLISAASGVVARRDMSLNRRLWAWLLGPEPAGIDDSGVPESTRSTADDVPGFQALSKTLYFEKFGLRPLVRTLLKLIERDIDSPVERARPFRICLSMMDRWEIGGLVVPDIFLPVVSSVRRYKEQGANRADFAEVLRSASVFFDGVESGLIWEEILDLLGEALSAQKVSMTERTDKLSLVSFIIGHFNIREEEMLLVHAPLATLMLLTMLENRGEQISSPDTTQEVELFTLALGIATDFIHLIPERAFSKDINAAQTTPIEVAKLLKSSNKDLMQKMMNFYSQGQGSLAAPAPPLPARVVGDLILRKSGVITCQSLSQPGSSADAEARVNLLVLVLSKVHRSSAFDASTLISSMYDRLSVPSTISFPAFASFVSLATSLYSSSQLEAEEFSGLLDPLVRVAWLFLSPLRPKYHVETVRSLWLLQNTLSISSHDIEASICSLIVEEGVDGIFASRDADPARRFAILWTHTMHDNAGYFERRVSRSSSNGAANLSKGSGIGGHEVMLAKPLFLLLDALLDERTQLFMTVRSWVQSLVGIDKLFHMIARKFLSFDFLQTFSNSEQAPLIRKYTANDDLDQCLYYLHMLSNVLKWSTESAWATLANDNVSPDRARPLIFGITGRDGEVTMLELFLHVCLRAISGPNASNDLEIQSRINQFHRIALTTLHQILTCPYAQSLADLHLEQLLIDQLTQSLAGPDPYLQVLLLDILYAALKLQVMAPRPPSPPPPEQRRAMSQETLSNHSRSRSSTTIDRTDFILPTYAPPASLIKCMQAGFTAISSRPVLDSWVSFLTECLPLYTETIFQILIPLTVTFCSQIGQTSKALQTMFLDSEKAGISATGPESTLISLLNGLEHVLARGHERLLQEEIKTTVIKSPDQPQGFFGNMVSGVFTSETPQSRSITANNRLTVLLAFQDAVRICHAIWSWGGHEGVIQDPESAGSFNYTSLRMRNRARRLLEHLFAAEALECLETMIEIWQQSSKALDVPKSPVALHLLHVLDGSRPKHTIPAIFNAIYSRTNPVALDSSRKSTLTSSLDDVDLVGFLVQYAESLEDDAMDEIWADCMTFLKDILANPFPHRSILPSLLEFAAILGEKVDNTNFGEQRRMRRELSDLFLRLLTGVFTTRPAGFSEQSLDNDDRSNSTASKVGQRSEDVASILATIAPKLPKILIEPDRISSAASTISTSLVGPTFKSKSFPDNVSKNLVLLIYQLARLPNTQKSWKKDVGDAFNDSRFFNNSISLVEGQWLPLLRQWTLSDKEKMPELLSRLTSPTTAGIVFGVGATSARLEADRKTQLNLRRIATLLLASTDDNFVTDLPALQERIVDLLSATTRSSPSSATRADVYMLLRALALKTSAVHLAVLWPIINSELHAAISSVVAADHSQVSATYSNQSVLQACKLLDTLLCIAPDDFQMHEWLFITDTIDAVYRPPNFHPVALLDELSEELGAISVGSMHVSESTASTLKTKSRHPLLGCRGINDEGVWERKDELVGKVLRPFFSQLSIFAFESTYSMNPPDWETCKAMVLKDIFEERSIVKAL